MLPTQQLSKGKWLPAQLAIQPDAEVMQGNFGGQAGLKPSQLEGRSRSRRKVWCNLAQTLSTTWRTPANQRRSLLGQGWRLLRFGEQTTIAP